MRSTIRSLVLLVIFLLSMQGFAAVNIVECEDEDGNRSFQKTCPPGTSLVSEKRITTGSKAAAENLENAPVNYGTSSNVTATMYVINECSPCDAVRELLQIKNIPVTEKNVDGDINMQAELTELNGSLNVPITLIGDKKLSGYNRTEIIAALKAAGWEDPNAPAKEEEKSE